MYFCLKSAYSGQTNTKWYSSSRSFMSQNVHLRSFRSNLLFEYRQREELVNFFIAVKSVVETKRAYCNHLNVRDAPDRLTVWKIVKKFRTERTVHNVNKGRSGSVFTNHSLERSLSYSPDFSIFRSI